MFKNRFQSNSKLNNEGDYLAGQSFNFPELKGYNIQEAWNFLRTLDQSTRSYRKSLLKNQKSRYLYLLTLPSSVPNCTLNIIKDQISLIEKTFEYTIWYEPNKNIDESAIYYYTDDEQ